MATREDDRGRYPRDLHGYGRDLPDAQWPGGARLAVSFVLNFEEGGERNTLHGDEASEHAIQDVIGAEPWPEARHMNVESMFEYGSRAGVWRLLDLFEEAGIPLTIFAVGMAVERSPDIVRRMADAGHEICSHGYRWLDYRDIPEETEREHIARAVKSIEEAVGKPPVGWYTGRCSSNTRRLVVEHGGFLYDSDSYSDDLPYWEVVEGRPHLVIPYTLDVNDMRFVAPANFSSGDDFFTVMRDSFDVLYSEGARAPKMMSVGLHTRLAGRPARSAAVARFIEYASGHPDVWFPTRSQIAEHWISTHPFQGWASPAPSGHRSRRQED